MLKVYQVDFFLFLILLNGHLKLFHSLDKGQRRSGECLLNFCTSIFCKRGLSEIFSQQIKCMFLLFFTVLLTSH